CFESNSIRWRTYGHTSLVQAFQKVSLATKPVWKRAWKGLGSCLESQLIKRRSGDRTAPTMKSTLRGLMFVAASAGLSWGWLSTPGIALADDTPHPRDP